MNLSLYYSMLIIFTISDQSDVCISSLTDCCLPSTLGRQLCMPSFSVVDSISFHFVVTVNSLTAMTLVWCSLTNGPIESWVCDGVRRILEAVHKTSVISSQVKSSNIDTNDHAIRPTDKLQLQFQRFSYRYIYFSDQGPSQSSVKR